MRIIWLCSVCRRASNSFTVTDKLLFCSDTCRELFEVNPLAYPDDLQFKVEEELPQLTLRDRKFKLNV